MYSYTETLSISGRHMEFEAFPKLIYLFVFFSKSFHKFVSLIHFLIQQCCGVALRVLVPKSWNVSSTNIRYRVHMLEAFGKPGQNCNLVDLLALRVETVCYVRFHLDDNFLSLYCYKVLILLERNSILLSFEIISYLLERICSQLLKLFSYLFLNFIVGIQYLFL